MSKIKWAEYGQYTSRELMQKHRINARQLEQQVSREIRGATHQETKEIYKKVYDAGSK
jgi:hypothetical protein